MLKSNETFRQRHGTQDPYTTLRRYCQDGATVHPADINNGLSDQVENGNESELGDRLAEVKYQVAVRILCRQTSQDRVPGGDAETAEVAG